MFSQKFNDSEEIQDAETLFPLPDPEDIILMK